MQEQLRTLIERHCATLRSEAAAVRTCLARLDDASADAGTVLSDGADLAHKIKGSSGSIGFREIYLAAQELESRLRALSEAEPVPGEHQVDDARRLATELDARVAALRPEESTLYNAT